MSLCRHTSSATRSNTLIRSDAVSSVLSHFVQVNQGFWYKLAPWSVYTLFEFTQSLPADCLCSPVYNLGPHLLSLNANLCLFH